MTSIDDALENLELQIGQKAQQGFEISFDPNQRKNVIAWLNLKGVWDVGPSTSNSVLGRMYGIPRYLDSVIKNQGTGKNKRFNQRQSLNFDIEETPSKMEELVNKYNSYPIPNPKPSNISAPESIFEKEKDQNSRPLIEITKLKEEFIRNQGLWAKELEAINQNLNNITTEISSQVEKIINPRINQQIEIQKQELKQIIEDTIFQSYLNHKINNETPESQSLEPQDDPNATTHVTHNSFIPKIDKNYHFDPYATKVIRSAITMGENLYVYGDTGCGKTTHLEQVCGVLGKGLIRINPHDGITREMFLGSMKLINNETIFVPGALPLAMKNGLVFLVDEISFLPPNLTAILNPIGEKGGKLYIPETSEWITPAPGFCIFATDNTGGKGDRTGNYTGTEVQNTATLDRFAFCLKMNYLPLIHEADMLNKRFPNQDTTEIGKMLRLATDIRSAFSRGELSLTLSTRKLIKFFDQRNNNFTTQESLNNTILSWLDEDDETLVKTMIDRLNLLEPIQNNSIPYSTSYDLINFITEIHADRMVPAIRELRRLKNTLSLKEAKDLAEAYRNGLLDIGEVELKLKSF